MTKKAIILHGTLGSPQENWFPWLAQELIALGYKVSSPQLPTPDGQTPENWVNVIAQTVDYLGGPDDQTIFIAHSMSCLSVCHYLSTITPSVKACIFAAGFTDRLLDTQEPYPTLNNPLIDKPLDWNIVRKNCRQFICFASDNDPYVPLDIAQKFAHNLNAEFILVNGGGHLSSTSGFTKFPQLLDKIKSLP